MSLRLDQVNLVSDDVPGSAEFYRLLGLTIEDTQPEWEPHHRSVDAGDAISLEIDSRPFTSTYWASEEVPNGALLAYRTDTRDEVDAQLRADDFGRVPGRQASHRCVLGRAVRDRARPLGSGGGVHESRGRRVPDSDA